MQDTPNFENYRAQFSQYSITDLLDARETIQEPSRSYIVDVYNKVNEYFTDNEYRKTLGTNRKNNIEGQISNILGQFDALRQWQRDGTTIQGANMQNVLQNISAYMDEFDVRFSDPHQLYRLQGGNNVDKIVADIIKQQDIAIAAAKETEERLTDADLLVGTGAGQKLANYYQLLANGRDSNENQKHLEERPKQINLRLWSAITLGSALLLFFILLGGIFLFEHVTLSQPIIISLATSLSLPLLVLPIMFIRDYMDKKSPGGYERSAIKWMIGAVISTVITGIFAFILIKQLGDNPGWEEIVPKIIGLLAPAYFVRFCVQNYKANKHLAIQNTHRATLAKVAKEFGELVSHKDATFDQDVLNGRKDIILAAANVMFTQSETGYITTKEGAGTGDSPLDGLNKVRQ